MKLEGVHHVTAITGDAPRNVDFYARVLGLRLVKKSVNQDDPTVYHLFYGDEEGAPGNDVTFFEYPGARQGKAGAGMVHTIGWRVASPEAVDFWESRLADEGIAGERYPDGSFAFRDPEGLRHALIPGESPDEPLIADHPEVPKEFALQGFHGVRAYAHDPEQSRRFLEQDPAALRVGGERAHRVEPAQRVLVRDVGGMRDERRVGYIERRELVLETLGIGEDERFALAAGLDSLAAETLLPVRDRLR